MKTTDILVIGGGPAGVIAAVTARKHNPSKKITLVRDKEQGVIPCGIPYIFNRLQEADQDKLPDKPLEKNDVDLKIGRALAIDEQEKSVTLKDGVMGYDKLILATGSKPAQVPIEGSDKEGVWQVKKDLPYLKQLRQEVLKADNIVIVGGGFIGVELAEELSAIDDLKVSIVERRERCLGKSFDQEFAAEAEARLKASGVRLQTEDTVQKIRGADQVEAVDLASGEQIEADLVLLSIGSKPRTDLVEDTKIKLGSYHAIQTDEYMRTNVEDVWAVGDCAETRDYFTGKEIPVMLASTATTEARIAATNLYHLEDLREHKGTLSAFSTSIDGLVLGSTGITEARAKKEDFDVVVGRAKCPNHHPGALPNTETISMKLIFSQTSKSLLGAQISGPESVSEMINILALAIQEEMTVYDLDTLQISTHPLLTAAPTVYPLIAASQSALNQLES